MNEIQIVETPIGNESEEQVRQAAAVEFPGYKIAAVDQVDGQWQVKLERTAEFPLKPMAPDEDGDAEADAAGGDDHDADDAPAGDGAEKSKKKAPKKPKDDSAEDGFPEPDADDGGEDKPAFGGGEHETLDPIERVEKLLRDLQKVVPQLQALLKGDGLGKDLPVAGPPHLDGADPGPHFDAPHPPPPTRTPGPPPGLGGPGAGGPPPMGIGGPRRGVLPTFTKRQTMRLNREANVAEATAREELMQAYPDYDVQINLEGDQYVATLTLKS